MIKTREELRQCLAADKSYYHDGREGLKWFLDLLFCREQTVIWRYVRVMRRCDYYTANKHKSLWHSLMYFYYLRKHNRLSVKLGLIIGAGAFGPGLCIYHTGNIVVNGYSRIGKNCRLHGSNCIGNSHGRTDCPIIGDNVRFGVGAKAFGNIYIANNVTVAAGAVVTKSCFEEGATLVGIPAGISKIQKNVNKKIESLFSLLHNLWVRRNSKSYIKWLRSKGVAVGDNCIFRHPRSIRIDVTRPSLVTIGDNVDMNMNFQILTHDWGCFVFREVYHDFVNSSGHVTIGNNIYFGTNVVVLKGVTIGDNCIIGACSLVTKDIPANSVATGVPCRVICSLDEYYEKRKQKALAEAVEYVKSIQKRFGRDPYPKEMREEFIYFVNKDNWQDYEEQGVPVKFQLDKARDEWLSKASAPFHDFNEFLRYANTRQDAP